MNRKFVPLYATLAGLAILATLLAPVFAADYEVGVSVGTYVTYGNWEAIGAPTAARMKWQKIEVIRASEEEVTLRMTGQLENGSAMPQNGETLVYNVATGTTNFTHGTTGFLIAANLNEGDKVLMGSNSYTLEKTEIRTYMDVSRYVNVFTQEISGVDERGPYTSRSTRVYDKTSGMLLEAETWTKWTGSSTDWVIYYCVSDTNIFSPQREAAGLPIMYVYPLVAVVVAATGVSGVVVYRGRKQPAKAKMLEAKVMDLTYNVSGVNRGECYLVDSMKRCVDIACKLHSRGVKAMAIVREDPSVISKSCRIQPEDVVVLSLQPLKGFGAINSLQDISIKIAKFLKTGGGAVILDGLEYLVSRFGFNAVYIFLQEKHIEFLEAGAVLLVPANMETLDSREKGQLLSELKLL